MKTQQTFRSGNRAFLSVILSGALVSACASAGTKPGDMTAAKHQAAAHAAEEEGGRHERRYDSAASAQAPCSPYDRELCSTPTSFWNPTEGHSQEGAQYRRFASKHTAASEALLAAEARACAGIPVAERDASPFRTRQDIDRVETIDKEGLGGGRLLGARIVLRSRAGASAEHLQHVIDCHLARWAVTGAADSAVPSCPLAHKDVTAKVSAAHTGFAVEIVAKDEQTAAMVIANARALVGGRK